MQMEKLVINYIKQHELPLPPSKLLVGVSGGADSIALLSVLMQLGYECIVAHCNFHLRGSESDRDELFVADFSKELNIPFYKIDFDTERIASQRGISIEMAARELRYDWFENLRMELHAEAIAVAHNSDDAVETFLMNIVRGCGIHGLTGIKPINGKVIRPLLAISRKEIEQYLQKRNFNFVTDSSNMENKYTRNKFRNEIIPLLETINPAAKETILSNIERLTETEIIYDEKIDEIKRKILTTSSREDRIYIPLLLRQKTIQTILFELLQGYLFNTSTINDIAKALQTESGKQFFSPTHRLIKDRDYLIITTREMPKSNFFYINKGDEKITNPIELDIHLLPISEVEITKDKNTAFFDADTIEYPLLLRTWLKGDMFYPFGMNGKKKISDYYTDKKYSLTQKENTYLLLSGNAIIWIVGERSDNRYRITKNTQKVLKITLKVSN